MNNLETLSIILGLAILLALINAISNDTEPDESAEKSVKNDSDCNGNCKKHCKSCAENNFEINMDEVKAAYRNIKSSMIFDMSTMQGQRIMYLRAMDKLKTLGKALRIENGE